MAFFNRKQVLAIASVGLVFGFLLALVNPSYAVIIQTNRNNTVTTSTTLTCSLTTVNQYDVLYAAISSDKSVSTVIDSLSDTYNSQVTTNLGTGTVAAFSYLYSATQTHASAAVTVTVTFSAAAHGHLICYDTAGYSATAAHTSTGSGTFNSGNSYSPAVTSFTPTLGNFEIAVLSASSCNDVSPVPTITGPLANNNFGAQGNTGSIFVNTGTSCGPSSFFNFLAVSYSTSSAGTATTEAYSVTSSATVSSNSANWAEVAADFTANTVNSQALTETNTLTVNQATATTTIDKQTITLSLHAQTAQRFNAPADGLHAQGQPAQQINLPQDCLGVNGTANGQHFASGVICGGGPVVVGAILTMACTFFQEQCWLFPTLYLGFILAPFIVVAAAFKVEEKSFLYMMLAGLTWGSLVEIVLGIMTPTLPIMLIVLNLAYSFRLDRVVVGRVRTD